MTKSLLVILIGLSLTGCAQLGDQVAQRFKPAIEIAKEDCTKIGYTPNTPAYLQCVQNITNQLRQARAIESTAPSYRNSHPTTISCRQVGSFVNCTEL
jgi:hypothetical protein